MIRSWLILPLSFALLLGVAACDSRDYEAEIAELQTQLEQARSEAETAQTENESLSGELEQMRAQVEEAQGASGAGDATLDQVQAQLDAAAQATTRSLEQVDRLAGAGEQDAAEAAGVLRGDLQVIAESVQAAASELGVQIGATGGETTQPAPAAGPEQGAGEQQEPAATEEQPATGAPTEGGSQQQ